MKITAQPESPTAPSATPEAWVDVLAGLSGLRLHAYDELLAIGEAETEELAGRVVAWATKHGGPKLRAQAGAEGEIERALCWLARHRLALRNAAGRWRARPNATAAKIFLERGPDPDFSTSLSTVAQGAQEGRADRRSQAQERHAETVERATLSRPAPPPPRPVHAPQFFDFGDY